MAHEFGEQLRHYRARAGASQNQLARQVEVDPSYINRLERSDREPPKRPLVERLADVLSLSQPERQRLLLAAGHAPDWLLPLGADDPTLMALAQRLADPDMEPEAKADLRHAVEMMVRRWGRAGQDD